MLRTNSFLSGLVLIAVAAVAAPKAKAETAWLGLVAGAAADSEAVQAADIASLFEQDQAFRVVPMLGDVGTGNLRLLLNDPGVDIVFVSTDALAAAAAPGATLSDHLELVARLAPQEVHVLARTEIGSLAELAGKKVSVGPQGSSSAATAAALFKALGIMVEPQHLDASTAIERLKQGTIDAAVIVGGKPYPLVSTVPANFGMHLLPVPFGASLEAAYLPTRIEQHDYPNLIQPAGEVPTVATGMGCSLQRAIRARPSASRILSKCCSRALRSYRLRTGIRSGSRSTLLQACRVSAARLPQPHGSMRARSRPGQSRFAAGPGAVQPASMPDGAMSNGDREALFQRFIEWQRSKAH